MAINLTPIPLREYIHATEFQNAFSAVGETAQDVEHVRNDHFVTLTNRMHDLAARKNSSYISQPALQNFNVNSEGHHIQPTDLNLLPPMRRRGRIEIGAGETLQADMMWPAQIIFRE